MAQRGKLQILPLLTGDGDHPLRAHSDLRGVQRHLGFPKWLYVWNDDPCCFLLGYGDLQIDIRTSSNRAMVDTVSIKLWVAGSPAIGKPLPLKWGGNKQIDLNGILPAMPLSAAKARADAMGLVWEQYWHQSAFETVCRLVLTHAELHFFSGDPEPILMEIHFPTPAEIQRMRRDVIIK